VKHLLTARVVFLSVFLWTLPCVAQGPKLEDLRVSFASFGVIYYPHFIARELGFYRDEGFNVDWIAMPGGLATKALISGDIQFSTSSGSSLNASLRDIRLKVVYVNLDRPLYRLLTWRDDIRKVTDLRGKGIGVASRGDTMEGSANLLLRKYGMDPVRDVIWVALGTNGRTTSLIAKAVDSAVLGFADARTLQTRGYAVYEVANIGKEIKMLYTGLATAEDFLVKRSDVVRRFIRATVKGREFLKLQNSVAGAREEIRPRARRRAQRRLRCDDGNDDRRRHRRFRDSEIRYRYRQARARCAKENIAGAGV
jgi:NitT/TauT family transport system substrate-binding protein